MTAKPILEALPPTSFANVDRFAVDPHSQLMFRAILQQKSVRSLLKPDHRDIVMPVVVVEVLSNHHRVAVAGVHFPLRLGCLDQRLRRTVQFHLHRFERGADSHLFGLERGQILFERGDPSFQHFRRRCVV